jgi:tryptophanyl-tRNA synthetase
MESRKIIFSGIQPSGNLHIGNYLGAIKQWVDLQTPENKLIFCIVDLHAITVPQDPEELRKNNVELAALYIACGIDPNESTIFIQSENPDHAYLGWVFNCIIPMGWMERMTQYKDKSKKQAERTSVGLFDYPALMAADILLYDTDLVPVGEDQTQHVELARDTAKKFNSTFEPVFKLPKVMFQADTARIMSLQDPMSKMSKSDVNNNAMIGLLDDPKEIYNKIKRAVTDSGDQILSGENKPALSNLLSIYSAFSGDSIEKLEIKYTGMGYGEFKNDLAEVVVTGIEFIQKRYYELMSDRIYLDTILDKGAETARSISEKKVLAVRQAVGLGR